MAGQQRNSHQRGNGKYGVASSGIAFFIKRSQFIRNVGTIGGQGGAVYLAGSGKSVFENTAFIGNVASEWHDSRVLYTQFSM